MGRLPTRTFLKYFLFYSNLKTACTINGSTLGWVEYPLDPFYCIILLFLIWSRCVTAFTRVSRFSRNSANGPWLSKDQGPRTDQAHWITKNSTLSCTVFKSCYFIYIIMWFTELCLHVVLHLKKYSTLVEDIKNSNCCPIL